MKIRSLLALLGFTVTAFLSMSVGYVFAQGQGGLRQEELAVSDLGQHFECMEGMVFRMARYEIPPHFASGEHNHRGRPGIFYVLDGSLVEHQRGTTTEYRAGQGFLENSDITVDHQIENLTDSTVTVVYATVRQAEE